MTLRLGPCSAWVDQDEIEKVGPVPSDLDADRVTELALVATEILFLLSGRRFAGECEATVRPARRRVSSGDRRLHSPFAHDFGPWGWLDSWGYCSSPNLNDPMCGCAGDVMSVELGAYPITAITEVTINGTVLSPSAYRLDGSRELVRIDGQAWPLHQNMNAQPGATDTWTVEYTYGTLPGPAGIFACAEYARQLCLAQSQDKACKLPERVQTITRQNVTMTILDPLPFIQDGLTGVPRVDQWLVAINRPAPQGRVFSPDYMPVTRPVS